jgi:TorA maturation chaperone TorD
MSELENEYRICCAYRAFSKLLRYPYDDVYEYIVKESLGDLKPLLELPFISTSMLNLIKDYTKELESVKNDPKVKDELRIEYVRLFDLPAVCSPYESVYYTGKLMSDPSIDILRRCKKYGLEPSSELPDHIAVELEFMYYLTYNVYYYLKQGNNESYEKFLEEERNFMRTHLSKSWVIRLFKGIKKNTQIGFYRIVAELTIAFLEAHAKYLGVW